MREASLELARLRRVRGAYRRTWRSIARAQARLAFAAALLTAPVAEPAAALDPVFRHGFSLDIGPTYGAAAPAFADIDCDGDLDVFVGQQSGNTFFFENTGTAAQAAFAPRQTNPFGLADVGTYAFPSFADLDGDGDLDALIATTTNRAIYFQNTGAANAPAFAAPLTNPFGLAALIIELADLDGDGDSDAFSSSSAGTVFHQNTGTAKAPAFAAPVTNPFGLGTAGFPDFADVDGDGDLDAFIVGVGSTVSFFENTGTLTAPAFAAPQLDPFGLLPALDLLVVDFGDVDGDGDLDAFSAGRYAEYWLGVAFENVGTASAPAFSNFGNPFGLGTSVSYYPSNYGVVAAASALDDIDGDGDLDALVSFFWSAFWRNTGTASAPAFAPDPIDPLDLFGNDPNLVDIDADGDLDAFVGVASGDTVFFENTGTENPPEFAPPATDPFGLANVGGYASPAFADLDDDGDLDALIGSSGGDGFFFENTGTALAPAFAAPQSNPFGLTSVVRYASPDLVDIDGDGDLDAFVGAFTGNIFFFANTGTASAPAFAASSLYAFGLTDVGTYASPDFADVDGDGDLDAFVGRSQGSVFFFANTGSAGVAAFATPTLSAFGIGDVGSYATPELADVDGDGDLDAVVGNLSGYVTFFENVRGPNTPSFVSPSSPNPFVVSAGDFVDIDADGDLDAFSGTSLQANTGMASLPAFAAPVANPFGLTSGGSGSRSAFSDIDADGDPDALVGRGDGSLIFFANTGSASAPAFAVPSTNPFGLSDVGSLASPTLGDIDGDGDLDLFVGRSTGDTLFFRNTGTASAPAFAAAQANPFGLAVLGHGLLHGYYDIGAYPEIADIDGDGDLDLFVGDRYGHLFFFENVAIDPDACADGLDNDGDGRVDLGNDAGCASAVDTSELSALQCDNGQDDDGDSKIDWRDDGSGDPHCVGLLDDREAPTQPGPGCGIGPELLLLAPILAAVRRRRPRAG